MRRIIGEWLWRVAMVCTLVWVGLELHGLRADLAQLADDDPAVTAQADGEDSQGCVDAVQQQVRGSSAMIAAATLGR